MRILGIDFGEARIGVAVSDPFGWTAQGIKTIHWKNDINCPIEEIIEIINEYSIEKVVVGMPKNFNNTLGERARRTYEFISVLKDSINPDIDVEEWDERCSTICAMNTLNDMCVPGRKKRGLIDKVAAVHILQNYLDYISNNKV
ncbi:MAG: Holliday junction resolvase RuvX [Clostridiales bacterium]|nr:Holliday junction resolvase RuvX [Clostridiales bacterium]